MIRKQQPCRWLTVKVANLLGMTSNSCKNCIFASIDFCYPMTEIKTLEFVNGKLNKVLDNYSNK